MIPSKWHAKQEWILLQQVPEGIISDGGEIRKLDRN